MSDYIDPSEAIKLRIVAEGTPNENGWTWEWTLDGIDADRNYTEDVRTFGSWAEAVAAAPDFWRSLQEDAKPSANLCDYCGGTLTIITDPMPSRLVCDKCGMEL